VADGDTISVRTETGQKEKIRFCGIDAPEVTHGKKTGQPFGQEAREKLRSLIARAGNQVIISPAERDRYGRTVAEVFVSAKNPQQPEEELFLNYELVRAGLAYHYAQYSDRCPNGKDVLVEAENEAKSQHLGVWSGNYQRPWDFRHQ
jgi:endonuclease YncB( thermonuclease family)